MDLGQWTHFAAVYDGVDIRIYKNGILIGTPAPKTDTIDSSSRSVFIGHREGEERFFDGLIDEVKIYDRALSATEILDIMTAN